MRKDVKLGMAIGGGLIVVLIGYLLFAPPSNTKKGSQLAGPNGNGSIIDGAGPGDLITSTDDKSAAGKTGTEGTGQAPPAEPRIPSIPVKSDAAKPDVQPKGAVDQWGTALEKGKLGKGTDPAASKEGDPVRTEKPEGTSNDGPGTLSPTAGQAKLLYNPNDAWGGGISTDAVFSPAKTTKSVLTATPTTRPSLGTGGHGGHANTHIVKSGDTLSSISLAAYGSGGYYPHILRANPTINPNNLKLDTVLILPPPEQVKAATPAVGEHTGGVAAVTEARIDPTKQYRVQSGDSLYRISIKIYGKSSYVEKIYEKNKAGIGADPKRLKLGMVLELPEKAPAAATPSDPTTSSLSEHPPVDDGQAK